MYAKLQVFCRVQNRILAKLVWLVGRRDGTPPSYAQFIHRVIRKGVGGVEYNIIMKIAPTIRRKKISKGTGVYDKKVVDKWWCGVVEWKKKSSVGW